MPITMHEKAKRLIEELKNSYGNHISFELLKERIETDIGSDQNRTVKPYLRHMKAHNLILEVEHGQLRLIPE